MSWTRYCPTVLLRTSFISRRSRRYIGSTFWICWLTISWITWREGINQNETHYISNKKGDLTLTVNWGLEKIKNRKLIQGIKQWQVLTSLHTSWRAEKSDSRWKYAISRDHQHHVVLTEAWRQRGEEITINIERVDILTEGRKGQVCISELWIWSWITYLLSRGIFVLVNHCSTFRTQDKLTYQLALKINWSYIGKIWIIVTVQWVHLLSEDTGAAYLY